jgi:transposase
MSVIRDECHTWRLGLMVAVGSGTDSEKTGDAIRLSRKGIVALVNGPDAHITPLLRRLALMYLKQLKVLPQPFDELVAEKAEIFKSNESCQRFATVSGIGPVIATALVSSVGDPSRFRNGRQFASQTGTHSDTKMREGETKLGGITKRGDTYLHILPQGR